MRIIHTSDWHLGRSFGERSLLDQQALFLDWLVDVVREEHIDLVTIAGDLFDRSVPSAAAVELFHDALGRLLSSGTDVAAITGNHDSAERLGSIDGLLTDGLVLRGGYRHASSVDIRTYADGPLAVVAVPFLDPVFAPPDATGTAPGAAATHETVLHHALTVARDRIPAGMRSIVLAHAFVANTQPSESERTLAVGNAGLVSASVFAGFDYVALGHLHRAQLVGGDERIRYSGAPLPYSFGETSQKEIVLVELDDSGDARTKPIPITVGRGVATIRGAMDELVRHPGNANDFVRIELSDPHPVPDAHRRLRNTFPHVIEIVRTARPTEQSADLRSETVRSLTNSELASAFLSHVAPALPAGDLDLVSQAVVRAEQAN